ncbi:MAG: glycosyltransferase [Bacteroidia bacterium]
MEHRQLHIISFDVPYPPSYGGVIDIYYKLKALRSEGIKIHLHCFEYGRAEALILEGICEKVYYYKRSMDKQLLISPIPFVVITRSSEKLMENLLRDEYPILFEGLHSCFHLNDERLVKRIKIVRTHNIEHDYYENLKKVEPSLYKKIYFGIEAKKLKYFEKILSKANYIATISAADTKILAGKYKNVHHITAFHPNENVTIKSGTGDFCLYHGNLEVGENNVAALYLVNEVFSKIEIPLIIAGRNPSAALTNAIQKQAHISLKANINTEDIDELIKNAQINVLPTFQATGIKLKLLAALYTGRHCVVNSPMVIGTGLEELCSIQDQVDNMVYEIKRLFALPFDMAEKQKREAILLHNFSNQTNVKKLIALF